jgi:hypothetical protein
LSELKDAEYFDDLRYFNNFEVWTVLRQQLSFLMTLANAAKLITFEKELNNNNPKITLKKIN